ncbi:MAG TPA: hypothetical protein VNV15_04735, partial [Opitutaceae bacterium]|nr:hypothetical protein [Opitutaceae bacterium]
SCTPIDTNGNRAEMDFYTKVAKSAKAGIEKRPLLSFRAKRRISGTTFSHARLLRGLCDLGVKSILSGLILL